MVADSLWNDGGTILHMKNEASIFQELNALMWLFSRSLIKQ